MTASERLASGQEHWTTSGGSNLFLWEKPALGEAKHGTVIFVHGSSMASQPTFDLDVPSRPDSSAMDWFRERGFDTWCFDSRGYGRSDKAEGFNAYISEGAEDIAATATYIQKARDAGPSYSRAGIGAG